MAAIGASNVTVTIDLKNSSCDGRAGRSHRGTIAFGDGALTYPSGGVPIAKAKLGCPNHVRRFIPLESSASGYVFEYDISAEKLVMMEVPVGAANTDVQLAVLDASDAPAALTLEFEVQGW